MFRKTVKMVLTLMLVSGFLVSCGAPAETPTPQVVVVKETVTVKETVVQVKEVTPTPAPTPVPQPKYGGTLRWYTAVASLDLDPHRIISMEAMTIHMLCYSTLTKIGPTGEVVGDLAESWKVSDDGLTYTFSLRKGVKFHNTDPVNGRELVADDVVYSVERVLTKDPTFKLAGEYARVASAKALDKYTVAITLNKQWAGFIYKMSGEHPIYIVPKEAVEKFGNLGETVIGSGPFMLSYYTKGVGWGMVKNPNYYVAGRPYLDGVEVRVIPESAARQASFLVKDIFGVTVDIPTYQAWQKQYPDMIFVPQMDTWGPPAIILNSAKPPFDDERVRKALSLAIDRRKLLETYGFGEGRLAGPIPPYASFWALPQEELLKLQGYREDHAADIAEAKRLLAEAGYPDGKGLQIEIKSSSGHEMYWKLANVVQARLKEDLGIEVAINNQDQGAFINDLIGGNFQIGVLVFDVVVDPDDVLFRFFHPDSLGKAWGITKETQPELIELIEKQAVAADPKQRQALVWEAQRMIIDKALWIYLVDRTQYIAYWDFVKGVESYPIRAQYRFVNAWLDR